MTRDGVSISRELEPGHYAATVCNRLDTARSTRTAIAAVELAMGLETDITRHFAKEADPQEKTAEALLDPRRDCFPALEGMAGGAEQTQP